MVGGGTETQRRKEIVHWREERLDNIKPEDADFTYSHFLGPEQEIPPRRSKIKKYRNQRTL